MCLLFILLETLRVEIVVKRSLVRYWCVKVSSQCVCVCHTCDRTELTDQILKCCFRNFPYITDGGRCSILFVLKRARERESERERNIKKPVGNNKEKSRGGGEKKNTNSLAASPTFSSSK